ncbi:universal stress protein [Trujillonella humicola]|uniref:universal stress protein n=1 Tax=Trujillonella humicola TaxID=3383699 RepID=UPI0039069C3F
MTWFHALSIVVLWVGAGVLFVFLLLYRRGYREGSWFVLGSVLGPLFAPIAAERARTGSTVLSHRVEPGADPGTGPPDGPGRRGLEVLVGVDGSAASARAVRDAAELVAPLSARVHLVTVVDADDGEHGDPDRVARACRLLHSCARRFRAQGTAVEAVRERAVRSSLPSSGPPSPRR